MQWVTYILRCADGTYYIGSTNDLSHRLHAHNSLKAGARYTKMRRPVSLIYKEDCGDLYAARKRENELKKLTRSQKDVLVKEYGL